MRPLTLIGLAILLLQGCQTAIPVPPGIPVHPETPLTAEVRTDYLLVERMRPEPMPPEPPAEEIIGNYLYQFFVRYPFAFASSTLLNIPPTLVAETLVIGTIPASAVGWHGPQDYVDDGMYYVYEEGADIDRMWSMTPQWLDDRYDLIRNNRREGLPADLAVPASHCYPQVDMLQPPSWNAAPRAPMGGSNPEGMPK